MWNNTDIPLAILITFRCYGTWLHGDERGSVDRLNNIFGAPQIPANSAWIKYNRRLLKHAPVLLNAKQRGSVGKAVRDTCEKRTWHLHAINVRTNHAHLVVAIGALNPNTALVAFKANATRQMREEGCWRFEHSPWVEKGSKRNLWNERSIANALDYVINGQGDDLPDFDY